MFWFDMTGLIDKPSEILCWIIDGQKIPMKKKQSTSTPSVF